MHSGSFLDEQSFGMAMVVEVSTANSTNTSDILVVTVVIALLYIDGGGQYRLFFEKRQRTKRRRLATLESSPLFISRPQVNQGRQEIYEMSCLKKGPGVLLICKCYMRTPPSKKTYLNSSLHKSRKSYT